ncbi:hypothetical protein CFIMG_001105RA [Ceratocystis fimbriata CBS 114723]|uniref:Something about silencing protein 4 domain-containing protein n=1 Tax=Ceratocystis fimbriata CBS 114723 TaxID=1035309 RepID=A0A2C5X6X3_9PEZI|nr:hypothetical protein CFIMG_001105RA [Ceratocystis fimbriata CBS 114723]
MPTTIHLPPGHNTVDQSKATLYSLDITTPCKKASAKPLPTTTQLPHTSASSSASTSSFSEAAAIVATRASKLAGGDVVARVKDRATSTASSASTDTETTSTSLPSRSGRKENVIQAKAAGALHSGKDGRLNTAVSAKTAGKSLSANKNPRKDTSPTESASVSSESQETGGRKLRSQEVTGFKSELALYFPEYDVVIGNVQKEENALDVSTPILISGRVQNTVPAVKMFTDAAFTNVYDVQRLDLSSLNLGEVEEDSLPDIIYEPCHRKAERQEKSVRNTERCRAQHERDQVVRILDSLQGPDWLKMLGVTSASDSRRKSFEPARHHFIKACEAVLEKFRQWSAEEKRRKAEKERAPSHHAVEFPALMRDRSSGHSSGESSAPPFVMSSHEDDGDGKSIAAVSVTSSNQDVVIEKQLYEETIAAEKSRRLRKRRGPGNASTHDETSLRKRQTSPFLPTPPPVPAKEMTSFFAKRHERDAAVHRHRRGGRNILAFGQPLPDMVVQEFELPQALIDETSRAQNE